MPSSRKLQYSLAALLLVGACGSDPMNPGPNNGVYVPFVETHGTAERSQVAAYEQMVTRGADAMLSATSFGAFSVNLSAMPLEMRCVPGVPPASNTFAELFIRADLCKGVVSQPENHSYAAGVGSMALGEQMHITATGALLAGAAATTPIAARAAAVTLEMTVLRYFYEYIYAQLFERSTRGWDRAFAASGLSNNGMIAGGLAGLVRVTDLANMTLLERDLFNLFVEGRNALEKALMKAGKSVQDSNASVALGAAAEVDLAILRIDEKLLGASAAACRRAFTDWQAASDERPVLYAKGRALFSIIGEHVRFKNMAVRTDIGAALSKPEMEFSAMDAMGIVSGLMQVYP